MDVSINVVVEDIRHLSQKVANVVSDVEDLQGKLELVNRRLDVSDESREALAVQHAELKRQLDLVLSRVEDPLNIDGS